MCGESVRVTVDKLWMVPQFSCATSSVANRDEVTEPMMENATLPGVRDLRTFSRTVGPPTSNICSFQSESLPGTSFAAYGLSDRTLLVNKVRPHPVGAMWQLAWHP